MPNELSDELADGPARPTLNADDVKWLDRLRWDLADESVRAMLEAATPGPGENMSKNTITIDGVEYVRADSVNLNQSTPVDGEQFVLVCTEHRGVFGGWVTDPTADPLPMRAAQMVVYWSSDMHGVPGLATKGPSDACRISDPADMTLKGITMWAPVTDAARKKWEASPWK